MSTQISMQNEQQQLNPGAVNNTNNSNNARVYQSNIVNLPPETPTPTETTPGLAPPPSYADVVDAPPPSYDSLYGRIKETRKSSKSSYDFLKNIVIILLGTIGCSFIVSITTLIPITMFVVGLVYINDCPISQHIPIYLLVGGGFGVVKQLLNFSARVRKNGEERDRERLRQSPTQSILSCFMFGWFICGSYFVYRIYKPSYDPTQSKYCHKVVYLTAFWVITSTYITIGIILLVMCCISVAVLALSSRTSDARNDNENANRNANENS